MGTTMMLPTRDNLPPWEHALRDCWHLYLPQLLIGDDADQEFKKALVHSKLADEQSWNESDERKQLRRSWLDGVVSPARFVARARELNIDPWILPRAMLEACYAVSRVSVLRSRRLVSVLGAYRAGEHGSQVFYGVHSDDTHVDVGCVTTTLGICNPDRDEVERMRLAVFDTVAVEAFLRLLQVAVEDVRRKRGIADDTPFFHVATSLSGAYDDPHSVDDVYQFSSEHCWRCPAIGVMRGGVPGDEKSLSGSGDHFWTVTNIGASQPPPGVNDLKAVAEFYAAQVTKPDDPNPPPPVLIAYNAIYSNYRVTMQYAAQNNNTPWYAVSPLVMPYIDRECGAVFAGKSVADCHPDAQIPGRLVQIPVFPVQQIGPTKLVRNGPWTEVVHQENSVDCGAWACFFAYEMVRSFLRVTRNADPFVQTRGGEVGAWLKDDEVKAFHAETKHACRPYGPCEKLKEIVSLGREETGNLIAPYFCYNQDTEKFGYPKTTRLRRAILLSIMNKKLLSFYDLHEIDLSNDADLALEPVDVHVI